MKCKLLTLLTCFHALSPTASTGDRPASYGEAGGSAALSSSVDTTPRHGLGAVTGIPAGIIADFLTRTPTDAAGACEVVLLLAQGKPFAILCDLSAVSRVMNKSFGGTEIRARLEATAAQKAIQTLNVATEGVCDLCDIENHLHYGLVHENTHLRELFRVPNHSSNTSSKECQLGQYFELLACAHELTIKVGNPGTDYTRATQVKMARAWQAAAIKTTFAGHPHKDLGNYQYALVLYEKAATLHQKASAMYGRLENGMRQAHALEDMAWAVRSIASTHIHAGDNHADAAQAHENSAALHQEALAMYGSLLENGMGQADALEDIAWAARSIESSHIDAVDNHAAAAQAYEKCATLCQEAAEIYGVLGDRERQADALRSAATDLCQAGFSHKCTGDLAARDKAFAQHERLNAESKRIRGESSQP